MVSFLDLSSEGKLPNYNNNNNNKKKTYWYQPPYKKRTANQTRKENRINTFSFWQISWRKSSENNYMESE